MTNQEKENRREIIHEFRLLIQSFPIKRTNYRWRIAERNKNIGWNECRLEMLKQIGGLK